ncbi:helix-turn-helix domain-containing protein [Microvirga puerhi]
MIGMSQERLAGALGLTFQQVQKYEKGVNRIGAGRLLEIAQLLGVSIDYFYKGIQAKLMGSERDPVAVAMNTPEGLRLARAFTRMSDLPAQIKLVELAEAIASTRAVV